MPNKDLEGKVAIVTGAGSGIGTGISKILHDRGATLALCDLYGESAEKTAMSLSKEFIFDSVDVTKLSDIEKFRDKTINKMKMALNELVVGGIKTNKELHLRILEDNKFQNVNYYINYLEQELI